MEWTSPGHTFCRQIANVSTPKSSMEIRACNLLNSNQTSRRVFFVRIPHSDGCYDPIRRVVTLGDTCFADYHCNDLPNTFCKEDHSIPKYNHSCQCMHEFKPFVPGMLKFAYVENVQRGASRYQTLLASKKAV